MERFPWGVLGVRCVGRFPPLGTHHPTHLGPWVPTPPDTYTRCVSAGYLGVGTYLGRCLGVRACGVRCARAFPWGSGG